MSNLILRHAVIICMAILPVGIQSKAQARTQGNVVAGERINRSVLTVGREVFSALDATALLAAWNSLAQSNEEAVEIQSVWLDGLSLSVGSSPEFEKSFRLWPKDVQVFFSIALIWVDVQKLNLFIPKESELSNAVQVFEQNLLKTQKNVPAALRLQMRGASISQKRKWVEMVLRAQAFLRIRGSVERNKNIVDVGWYWHSVAGGSKTQ